MLTKHIALISETSHVDAAELNIVAAALQKQAVRDFGPIWDVAATVSAFSQLADMPSDYWPIVIRDDIKEDSATGVHKDDNGQPFALVKFHNGWSLTASHELVEMLADPFGDRLVAGESPMPGQGRVNFLVEVADPSEDAAFAYTVNGVTVSDFYTPHYFDPVAAPGVRYNFGGQITEPRTILKGGYLSWNVPETDEWFQQTWFDSPKPVFVNLGIIQRESGGSLRSTIDRLTVTPQLKSQFAKKLTAKRTLTAAAKAVRASSAGRAARLRQAINALTGG